MSSRPGPSRRLLHALLVLALLVPAPATLAAGHAAAHAAMSDAAMGDAAMGDMPCCDHERPGPQAPCCDGRACPDMASCMASCSAAQAGPASRPLPISVVTSVHVALASVAAPHFSNQPSAVFRPPIAILG